MYSACRSPAKPTHWGASLPPATAPFPIKHLPDALRNAIFQLPFLFTPAPHPNPDPKSPLRQSQQPDRRNLTIPFKPPHPATDSQNVRHFPHPTPFPAAPFIMPAPRFLPQPPRTISPSKPTPSPTLSDRHTHKNSSGTPVWCPRTIRCDAIASPVSSRASSLRRRLPSGHWPYAAPV